jgi:hypothetical protein
MKMRVVIVSMVMVLAAGQAVFLSAAEPSAPPQAAGAPAATATAKYSADTPIGTLLDDPAAKAVLVEHIPEAVANPQFEQARGVSLNIIAQYIGEDKVKAIAADLASLK